MTITATAEARVWWTRAWMLAACLLLIRICYVAWLPLGLIHDEAYYWDWSRQLDWGYYSKPPGVAWIIAAATIGDSTREFFVRLPAILLATGALVAVYGLASHTYGGKAGFCAAVLTALTPGNAVMSVVMTIDAPFMFCWTLALYCYWRMLHADEKRVGWSLATLGAVGLGLLCKQTMLAFPVLAFVFAVSHPATRRELRRPTFWLAGLGSLLFLLPVLWWNYQHGWITLAHTQSHFATEPVTIVQRLRDAAESWAAQLGLMSPTTWLLMIGLFGASWRSRHVWSSAERYLLTFSALPLAGVLLLSLKQRVEPNWPAPFYVAGLVLLGGVAVGCVPSLKLPRHGLAWALSVGLLATTLTYGLPYIVTGLGWKGSRIDPVVRMWGWQELGECVAVRLRSLADPSDPIVVVIDDRAAASELAFYLPGQPHVHLWNSHGDVGSQYDIWGLPSAAEGRNVMVVSRSPDLDPRFRQAFRHVTALEPARVDIGNGRLLQFYLHLGSDLQQWPTAVKQLAAIQPPETATRVR